jgi:hypothetical protein
MNNKRELVTRVSDQEYVKATIIAVIIKAVNWRNIPSFSEIPIWSTLAVLVNVFDAWPLGSVSSVDIDKEKSD